MSKLLPAAFVTFTLLVAACATSDGSSSQTSDETTGVETTADQTPSTSEGDLATTSSTAPLATSPTAPAPVVAEILDYPPGLFLEGSVYGERLVLFGAAVKGNGGLFWATDEPFETATNIFDLSDPSLDPGSINQMVYFEGRYYAFPVWAEAEDQLVPTMYVSDDGLSWSKTGFGSITKQASLRLTPDPPSALGGAGVASAIVANGQIQATGWVTENDIQVPVLWVGDGTTWIQSYLPTVEGATQGGSLAASSLGRMATLSGGSHFGFGTFVQTPGNDWVPVAHGNNDNEFTRFIGASDRAFYHLEYTHDNSGPVLTTSVDGETWSELDLPSEATTSIVLQVAADDRVVAYDPNFFGVEDPKAIIWSLTEEGWVMSTYEGTRVVLVDDNHIVTASDDQFFVYERS